MLGNYLNQDAVWLKPGGYGPDGPIMDETPIKVRWEGKRRLVRDATGQQVVSEGRVYCREPVEPEHKIRFGEREWPVITVSVMPGLDGKTMLREVAV